MTAKRYAMAVDTRACVACKACVVACQAENGVPLGFARTWLEERVEGTFPVLHAENLSERCNQCSEAPCVEACPTGASHYDEGGVVLVDHDECTGCKACMAACPYDARYIHPDGYADKCTFCLHRVKQGLLPACAEACPIQAITFGDRNDPHSEFSKLLATRKWHVLHPEAGTDPNVFYLE